MSVNDAQEPEQIVPRGFAPIRGTQSFVHTLSSCWSRPALTALEVAWRWSIGVPLLWLVGTRLKAILAAHTHGTFRLSEIGLDHALVSDPVGALTADPMGVVVKVGGAMAIVSPDLLRAASWLLPILFVGWIVVSSLGRTAVLLRTDRRLFAMPWTLMQLQSIRMLALAAALFVWMLAIGRIAEFAVKAPIAAGQEPELVLYCALSILATLGLFCLWAVVSWVFSIAPLLAMLRGIGAIASLKSALQLGPLRAKLVEVNLVMGIVKIALVVLAMVFSASPLPFETVSTQAFLLSWWAAVTILYLVGADFFHVARMIAYLDLWRAYYGEESGPSPEKASQ